VINRTALVGLASISILLSACVSIKDGPGFSYNVDNKSFQRSAAVKRVDEKKLNLNIRFLSLPKKQKDQIAAVKSSPDRVLTLPC